MNKPALTNDIKAKLLQRKKIVCITLGSFIAILLALRHDLVGTDTQIYHDFFDRIDDVVENSNDDITISSEIGFRYFVLFFNKYLNFRVMIAFISVLYMSVISYYIYKYSKIPIVSYFLFMFFGYFIFTCTMRQDIALSIAMIAFQFALRKKLIPFLILMGLATSFHVTALLFIPIYWLMSVKFSIKNSIIFALSFLLILLCSDRIFNVLISFSEKKYETMETGGYFIFVMYLLILIIALHNYKSYINSNGFNKVWLVMMLMVILLFPISKMNPAWSRIYMYFGIFFIIALPNIVHSYKNKVNSFLILLFFLLVGVYNFYIKTNEYGIRQIPYVFYWEDYYQINPTAPKF
jgi:hypothetical protein